MLQNYKNVSLYDFARPRSMNDYNYRGPSDHHKFDRLVELVEECQLQQKPCRAYICSGARKGTIFKISNLPVAFTRAKDYPHIQGIVINRQNGFANILNNLYAPNGVWTFAFQLDNGKDVTAKYNKAELHGRIYVLLDCDLPTVEVFTKTTKAVQPEREVFKDRFGVPCPPGTFVAFGQRNQDTVGVAADINFGKILSYIGKNGVRLRDLDGNEVQLNKLASNTIVAMDRDIMKRLMLTKLGSPA